MRIFNKHKVALLSAALMVTTSLSPVPAAFAASYNDVQINADLNATQIPDHITLTWSQDPMTTQTITWRTSTAVTKGLVQYQKATGNDKFESKKAVEVTAKMQEFDTAATDINKGRANLFNATLTGLEPGTTYIYVVGDGTNWSDTHTFTTEAKKVNKFKFLVFGDSQSGDMNNPEYTPWHDTLQKSYQANKDAKFFINVGDLVEKGQDYRHWNNWFNATAGVIDSIPDMVVQGNHETYNAADWNSTKPQYFVDQFNVFQNGPEGLKGQTYSYDYGNVHFVVLDSQEDEETVNAKGPDILEPQKQWLDNDLAAHKDAQWKVVFFHKTPYYNKSGRANAAVKKAFDPIFDKYHVDVVFNGHDHGVSRTYPIKNDELMQNPKDGTVYYVTGRSGNKWYPDLTSKIWDAKFYDPQDQPNYQTVEVNDEKLTVSSLKEDGTLIDRYVIDKNNPGNSTMDLLPAKYNTTRLVIYGDPITFGGGAKVVDGRAYVDAVTLAARLGGTYDLAAKTLTLGENSYVFTGDKLSADGKMIAIDALNTDAGFNNKYDSQLNAVMIEK